MYFNSQAEKKKKEKEDMTNNDRDQIMRYWQNNKTNKEYEEKFDCEKYV